MGAVGRDVACGAVTCWVPPGKMCGSNHVDTSRRLVLPVCSWSCSRFKRVFVSPLVQRNNDGLWKATDDTGNLDHEEVCSNLSLTSRVESYPVMGLFRILMLQVQTELSFVVASLSFRPCGCRSHCCWSCHVGLKPKAFATQPKL